MFFQLREAKVTSRILLTNFFQLKSVFFKQIPNLYIKILRQVGLPQ